jgi:hypothetical protein
VTFLLAGGLGIGTLIGLGKIALVMMHFRNTVNRERRPWEGEQPPIGS